MVRSLNLPFSQHRVLTDWSIKGMTQESASMACKSHTYDQTYMISITDPNAPGNYPVESFSVWLLREPF